MKRLSLFVTLFVSFVLATASANAQIGVYVEYNATHIPALSFTQTAAAWYQGLAGGAYADLLHAGPIALGLDVRGGYANGQGHNYRDLLIGPRLAVKPPLLPIRPYIQVAVGVGGVQSNGIPAPSTYYSNKFQYGFIGGVDYTLVPHLDLRLAEISYLRRTAVTSGGSAPALNLVTIGAGLVLRLP